MDKINILSNFVCYTALSTVQFYMWQAERAALRKWCLKEGEGASHTYLYESITDREKRASAKVLLFHCE